MSAPTSCVVSRIRVGARLGRHSGALALRLARATRLELGKIRERARTGLAREPEQSRQQLGGDQCISAGTVSGWILEAEPVGDGVETAGTQAGEQPSREPYRTKSRTVQREIPNPLQLGGQKGPVEAGVVRHEHP